MTTHLVGIKIIAKVEYAVTRQASMHNTQENRNRDDIKEVEEKLGRTSRYMQEVRNIGSSMKKEEILLGKRRVMQIIAELEDIRDILVDSVKDSLSPRQLSVLDYEEEDSEADPSVQFFGVEWDSVFAKCFSLGLNIRIFKQRLECGLVDSINLASILTDLSMVEKQMEQHSIALLSGRLSSEQLAQQLQQQVRVWKLGQVARSNNMLGTQEEKVKEGRKNCVKYRKNKTENLAAKISETGNNERRKSSLVDMKKKSSIVEKLSSLLDYV